MTLPLANRMRGGGFHTCQYWFFSQMRRMHWYDTSYFTSMWVKIKSGSKAFQRLGEPSPLLWSYCTESARWFVFLTLLYGALQKKRILILMEIKAWKLHLLTPLCWSLLPSDLIKKWVNFFHLKMLANTFSPPISKTDLHGTGVSCLSRFYWSSVQVHDNSCVVFLLHERKIVSLNMKVNQVFFYPK